MSADERLYKVRYARPSDAIFNPLFARRRMNSNRATNNHPLLISQVEPPQREDGGDYYYRTQAPGMAMSGEEGIYVINLTNVHRKKEEIMRQADVLILKNICDPDLLPLIKERKKKKKLTVYELADDICAIPQWNPLHFFYNNKENLSLFKRLANYCDAMQFSVPELRRLYGYLNPYSAVFPNQILDVPLKRESKHFEEMIIGWGGSHGHLEDMAEVAEPLINWIVSRDNVSLYLMCSDPIWQLFDRLPSTRKRRFKTGSLNEYCAFLREIDIGLAPLKDTAFNRSRSDVKFLEYAAHEVVPVVQSLVPYVSTVKHGETGFLFEDTNNLIYLLESIANNVHLIPKVRNAARNYIVKERLQHRHGRERVEFYKSRLEKLQRGMRSNDKATQVVEALSKNKGAVFSGRYLRLMHTQFENLLHDGLVLSQVDKKKSSANVLFSTAAGMELENYLPYLFGASCSDNTADCLNEALKRNPQSLKSLILLGEEYARKGDIEKSIQCFESAAEIFPEYEIPYVRIAAILQKLGHEKESSFFTEKAKDLIVLLK
jgi:glycosyltransferase involved in cell wall biosynthesis